MKAVGLCHSTIRSWKKCIRFFSFHRYDSISSLSHGSLNVLLSLTSAALTPSYFMFQLLCCESEMKLISVLIFHTHTLLADGVGVSVMDSGDDTRPEQWRRLQTRALLFSAWVESQTSVLESLHFEMSQIFKCRPTSSDTQLPSLFLAHWAFFPSYF